MALPEGPPIKVIMGPPPAFHNFHPTQSNHSIHKSHSHSHGSLCAQTTTRFTLSNEATQHHAIPTGGSQVTGDPQLTGDSQLTGGSQLTGDSQLAGDSRLTAHW